MTVIHPGEVSAVRDLLRGAGEAGVEVMLIGAAARLILIDWKVGGVARRATTDWDFATRVDSWEQVAALNRRLTQGTGAAFVPTGVEHRLKHRSGVHVDFVPFGRVQNERGIIRWPGSSS